MSEKEKLLKLKNRFIKYRDKLNLPESVSFGIEIEYENIETEKIKYLLELNKETNPLFNLWQAKSEIDICEYNQYGEEMNGEITSNILRDNKSSWRSLDDVLNLLKINGAVVTEKCGAHVSIGSHILEGNVKYWIRFILLWLGYSKEIYSFCTGEYSKIRNNRNFVRSISDIDLNELLKIESIDEIRELEWYLFDKYHEIYIEDMSKNFSSKNRIEFRLPNGTLQYTIWQNYINFFARFLLSCKKEFDEEKFLYNIINNQISVIDLVNHVYDSNLDKEFFLIQILKSNPEYNKTLTKHIEYNSKEYNY